MVTCDVCGAFMHADMDEVVHLKLDGDLAKVLVKKETPPIKLSLHMTMASLLSTLN